MVMVIPLILPLLGISRVLLLACESSWVCSVVLFFCSVVAARIFISAMSSEVRASLLVFFFGFCFLSFFCGVSGIMELLLPKICWLTSSSEDMSIRFAIAEDS